MTDISAWTASRSDDPRFLVLSVPSSTGASALDFLADCSPSVRRVRVVPDPAAGAAVTHWPSFDGFAIFDRKSHTLVRLFVRDPATGCVLEWQLGCTQIVSPLVLESSPQSPVTGEAS